jgi:hypothetical protein
MKDHEAKSRQQKEGALTHKVLVAGNSGQRGDGA